MAQPGQAKPLALLISGFWTMLMLFILIIGHVVWAFIAYGTLTKTDAIHDLESFLPMLSTTHLYILAGLVVIVDIWIFISHRKERKKHLQR